MNEKKYFSLNVANFSVFKFLEPKGSLVSVKISYVLGNIVIQTTSDSKVTSWIKFLGRKSF